MKNICITTLPWRRRALIANAVLMAVLATGCSPAKDSAGATGTAAGPKATAAGSSDIAIARGKIEVEGGLLQLAVQADGVVREISVKEGQAVQRGQLLLTLADDALRADAAVAESEWHLAQTRTKAHAERLPALRQTLQRLKAAADAGAGDAQSRDDAAQAVRDAEAAQAVAEAEVRVAQAKLKQVQAALSHLELRAPDAATVVRVVAQVGARAQAASAALVLLPKKPLIVRAELNESFAQLVQPGMRASVVSEGEGGQESSLPAARVLRVSPVYGSGHLQEDVQRGPVRVVESVLVFDEAPKARVGQNVRVTFHE